MSATLRHVIGLGAAEAIEAVDGSVFTSLGARVADHWRCVAFTIQLPRYVEKAWRLREICAWLREQEIGSAALYGCATLAEKLTLALGLPSEAVGQEEDALLRGITESPGDLSRWGVYADWLLERGEWRGELIAGWLGPRPIPTLEGIPEMARERARP